MARGKGTGKKSGSKPTSKSRSKKQSTKSRYARAREDAQLEGLIPTTPEGALKPERVDPATQEDPPQIALVAQAIRQGWAVPEERKARHVDELSAIVDRVEVPAKVKVAAFQALRMADKDQYERDHPEEAGKAKGGAKASVTITNHTTVQTNIAAVEILNRMLDDPIRSLGDCASFDLPSASGDSGHGGEMEASATPTGNQQDAGKGVAHSE